MRLNPLKYHTMLHFFRSNAYEVKDIYKTWTKEVVKDPAILQISDRIVLNGDHTKESKEGRKMPGNQIHHQESENSGKGEFIAGHIFVLIGAVMTKGKTSRNISLVTEREQSPPKKPGKKPGEMVPDGDTLVVQMAKLAIETAKDIYEETGKRSIGAFDAYFSKGTMFKAVKAKPAPDGELYISIVTRAQSNYVGFKPAELIKETKRGPGRPRKEGGNVYGEKIVLNLLLNDTSQFTETTMTLYGKEEKVKYLCLDLLWKATDSIMRFVVVDSSIGQCVLMTDDLTLTAEEIITIYCLRFKIETSFDEQKNEMGCFEYRFWTRSLEKRARRKAATPVENTKKIDDAKKAISVFVCLCTIATGILTIIAFKHDREIWARYPGWLRTVRSYIPSIAVTKAALAHDFHVRLRCLPHLNLTNVITPFIRNSEYLYDDFDNTFFDDVA
jgi:hypothetical protein